ncbi:hypothetical protein ACP70R_040743 [Stipagrostis hirtigluma subsp. patula]
MDKQQQLQQGSHFLHHNSKVIAIGGEAGTMGFVDLWRGILLCDVLSGNPKLRYVTVPPPILPDEVVSHDRMPNRVIANPAHLLRDIAVIRGRIEYVDMQINWKKHVLTKDYRYTFDGWMAKRWSRPVLAANSVPADNSEDWRVDCDTVSSDDIVVDNNPHFELLPKPQSSEGLPMPPFKGLAICHPALSLNDDDSTVYFMAKITPEDDKGWVIAVNMINKELLGVARFAAERTCTTSFAYVHSRISKYLTGAPGAGRKEGLKRQGHMLAGPANKKPPGVTMVPFETVVANLGIKIEATSGMAEDEDIKLVAEDEDMMPVD